MAVFVFGADGYIGWPLSVRLARELDEEVIGVDNLVTRKLVEEVGGTTALPIGLPEQRVQAFRKEYAKNNLKIIEGDLTDGDFVDDLVSKYRPETVYHLAQQRSAPYSMIDRQHAAYTEVNNVLTNLNLLFALKNHSPKAHVVKMGTMGEYGTPTYNIEEGWMNVKHGGKSHRIMVPRDPGSWYHVSKVFDTYNLIFANKVWNIRATDVQQGVVYGSRTEDLVNGALNTRLDFDGVWGTVMNKYFAQIIAFNKMLIYGTGLMKRGFLSLQDSIDCLFMLGQKPADEGEYRVVNQMEEIHTTMELAKKAERIARKYGFNPEYETVEDPRVEKQRHNYSVSHRVLRRLGFRPRYKMNHVLEQIMQDMLNNAETIRTHAGAIRPAVYWNRAENKIGREYLRTINENAIRSSKSYII
ncbi:MAG: NAD-dependent epimerase/dehydratase family protein [Nitrososphaerota archaeon]|nr:NAD-dependent epimerase/dehydratase family protein [Nitrososphaerota archaeon]